MKRLETYTPAGSMFNFDILCYPGDAITNRVIRVTALALEAYLLHLPLPVTLSFSNYTFNFCSLFSRWMLLLVSIYYLFVVLVMP